MLAAVPTHLLPAHGHSVLPSFLPTEIGPPSLTSELTPDAAAPDTDIPDVLTDFGIDKPGDDQQLAALPTLSHIGRYALKRRLAEGGLGAVFEAWDPLLSRTVAVKTLHFDVDTPSRLSLDGLFLNEARTAGGLNHRYIVTVHDAGLSAQGVYIAMERLYGQDMRDALAQGWRPAPERAALLVRRIADALAYAHARGVVHCDIKPANIYLTRRWRPKVLDFGIARAAGAASPALEGLVAGSPHYLAPEQLRGEEVDARTDVYSLGVVFHELLTGRKAFDGNTLDSIIGAVHAGMAKPAHQQVSAVPLELSDIAARAMAARPQDRYASATEFANALRSWVDPRVVAARAKAQEAQQRTHQASRRRLALTVAAVTAAVVALVASLAFHSPAPPAAATIADVTTLAIAPPAQPATLTTNTPEPVATASDAVTAPPVASAAPSALPLRGSRTSRTAIDERPAAATTTAPAAPLGNGAVQLAISPWGQVEVNGASVGTTPPLTQLTLPAGQHSITVRNADFPPFTATVQVSADKPAVLRHRFGS